MKAYFNGPMPHDDLFQLLWEFRHNCVDRHGPALRIKYAILTVHFCDDRGRIVPLYNEHGRKIETYRNKDSYHSAADYYDAKDAFHKAQSLEPQITTADTGTTIPPADTSNNSVPFGPI